MLIRDSSLANELSELAIHRSDNELRFTRKGQGYTLFKLKLADGETPVVKLIGLDGYGLRNREFLRYVCNLVKEIAANERH